MKLIKQKLLPFISNKLNTGNLIRHSRTSIIFPFYHTISDENLPHISNLYRHKTIHEFQKDLDYLLNYFQPVSMEEVYAHTNKEKIISRPSFHLSFDDGLKEIYSTIFPILWNKGIPFTIFLNSAFIDNRDLFFRYKASLIVDSMKTQGKIQRIQEILSVTYLERTYLDQIAIEMGIDFNDYLKKYRPYLFTQEIKELKANGVTIGAHSIDHPLYTTISENEQVQQTLKSCAYIRENFGEELTYFAFPFSDADISAHFFSRIYPEVNLTFGISGINSQQSGKHLGRIDMEKSGETTKEIINRSLLVSKIKK